MTDVGKNKEKEEPLYIVGGNASWCSHSGKHWRFLKKLKITIQETTAVGEDMEKEEPSYTVDGNANWSSHSGEQCGGSSRS